jgi:class 3 adenylate cyclase
MVCYFVSQSDSSHLWNALLAAQQVREAMRRLSKEWQLRKGWTTELYMNTGIDEGQEWLGTLRRGAQAEFTVLGDAANHAAQISNFARSGAVWVTRNLVGRLQPQERARLKYGVHRRNGEGREVFVASTFSRVANLADLAAPGNEALNAIAWLPITEVVDVGEAGGTPDRGSAARSH